MFDLDPASGDAFFAPLAIIFWSGAVVGAVIASIVWWLV